MLLGQSLLTLLRLEAWAQPVSDCNLNGKPDLADIREARSADLNQNSIPDECETAPFELGSSSELPLGIAPRAFVCEDFTGDGLPDIASACSRGSMEGPRVSIFVNVGGGLFEEAAQAAGPPVARLAAGDLDSDGDLDLAALDATALWWVANDGKGAFGKPARLLVADGVSGLAVGRFDGDGTADIAVTKRPEDVLLVFRGSPGGVSAEPASFRAGTSPGVLAVLDADGDGDLDLAAGCQQPGGIQLLLCDRAGKLSPGARLEAGGVTPELLAAGDWNSDGLADLAAAARFALVVIPNAARGAFGEAVSLGLPRDGPPVRSLAAEDADSDGDQDLLAGLAAPPGALIAWNRGDGVFNASARLGLDGPPLAARWKDLDGDGDQDLVLALHGSDGLTVLWCGPEEGREGKAPQEDTAELELHPEPVHMGFEPHSCALADLDGDQDLDMAVIDGETNLNILKNEGDGSLGFDRSYSVRDSLEMISLAAVDLDRDRDIDIALADEYTGNVLVLLNDGHGVLRQTGTYGAGERPTNVTPGDLNGDGVIDLICVNEQGNSLSLFEGRGQGKFGRERTVLVESHPFAAATGDFDGDRRLDIAVACYGASKVLVLFGSEEGAFQRRKACAARWPTFVISVDLDGDAHLDLAAAGYGARAVTLLRNKGDGSFEAKGALDVGAPPYTLLAADLNGDGRPDIVTANTMAGTLCAFLNRGGWSFSSRYRYPVGMDPRFAVAGDIDRDGDVDVISANHSSLDLTVLLNETRRVSVEPFLRKVCTEAEFHRISIPASSAASSGAPRRITVSRETKFVIPADPRDPALLPPVFQDVRSQPLHQQFLAEAFPERFPALSAGAYDALTGRRASRKYWSGILRRLRAEKGVAYGFTLLADFADDPDELPTAAEARQAHETLASVFALRPLAYYPESTLTRVDAAKWIDPGFPVILEKTVQDPSGKAAYQSYTRGTVFGRVRVLTQAAFQDLNSRGGLSFQDILILEVAPRDIEGVVAGVITAEPQGDLSHLALRTARRGTPNAYLEGALAAFARWDGRLVRLDVGDEGCTTAEASPDEASVWWSTCRPRISPLPAADASHGGLDGLLEIGLDSRTPPESRFGGKASNFARLVRLLDGPFASYREVGFAIPMSYYFEFLRTNRVPSAVDPGREVPCEEFLAEIASWPAFQSDSRLRFEVLQRFRESLEADGEVDPDLVARLARRIREVFGRVETAVRFRSSSNVEDALEFNGAGLYESTSACAADDLDGDDDGPSRCDPSRPAERGIAKALKHVWASLWSFRAHEERAYYGIPQESAAMGILVSTAFPDERANGVAMTGNPQSAGDDRFIVTAQVGEESVVSPEPGLLAERNLLEVSDGIVAAIQRVQPSSLAAAGGAVLSDRELEELGALLGHIDRRFPMDLGGRSRKEILLDVEFKIDGAGCLAVKQVRPFLRQDAPPPPPVFELVIPPGTEACGTFVPSRAPRRSYELKAALRFVEGTVRLSAREVPCPVELIEELRVGPGQALAAPRAPGTIQAALGAGEEGEAGRFSFAQSFELPGGETFDLELHLRFDAARSGQAAPPLVLDEEYMTRKLSLQGTMGLVTTFASCGHESLPLWEVAVELEGGSRVKLHERHEPPPTLNDTGPASLSSAEVFLPGERPVVDDYWHLVYTSLRHNRAVRYWVLLEPALELAGLARPVRAVEIVAPEPKMGIEAAVTLLDGSFDSITSLGVLSYRRGPAPASSGMSSRPPPEAALRGHPCDTNGDGEVGVADALAILLHAIYCEPAPSCLAAADVDSDGVVTPLDAAMLLQHVVQGFRGQVSPETAFPCE